MAFQPPTPPSPTPSTGGVPTSAPEQQGDAGDGGGKSAPNSREQALLRKLRKAEKEAAALREADEARRHGEMSEFEKLKAEATKNAAERDEARAKLQKQAIQHRFERQAAEFGAVDPSAAYKLADLSTVEVDESGEVSGLDTVLSSMKTQYGFLFQQPPPPAPTGAGSHGGNPVAGNPGGALTADRIGRMTSAEFAALQAQAGSGQLKI